MLHQRLPHPRVLFILHLLLHKRLQQPRQLLFPRSPHPGQQPVHRLLEQPILIELDLKTLVQLQVPRKTANQPMDKAVNRHHREILVMMQHLLPHRPRPTTKHLRRQPRRLLNFLLHRPALASSHVADFLEHPVLHLLRRFVRERQRTNRPKEPRRLLRQTTRQIRLHQPKRLARPR